MLSRLRHTIAALAVATAVALVAPGLTLAGPRVIPIGAGAVPAISADGTAVAYASAGGGVAVHDVATGAERTAAPGVPIDGTALAAGRVIFASAGRLYALTADGGVADVAPGDQPALSLDGRLLAFSSESTDLVADDRNGVRDVFVRDLATGATTLVSQVAGFQGDRPSALPAISPDGRFVTFASAADNLVYPDTNGHADVFLTDLPTRAVELVDVGPFNRQANAGPADPTLVSAISDHGRFVAFESPANNLTPGDQDSLTDVYRRDRRDNVTALVSTGVAGPAGAPAISSDGRMIAFTAGGHVLLRDMTLAVTSDLGPASGRPALSGDGNRVAVARPDGGVVVYDAAPPALRWITRPAASSRSRRPRYAVAASDPAATTVLCRIDARALTACPASGRFARLRPGRHLLRVLAGGPVMRFAQVRAHVRVLR